MFGLFFVFFEMKILGYGGVLLMILLLGGFVIFGFLLVGKWVMEKWLEEKFRKNFGDVVLVVV